VSDGAGSGVGVLLVVGVKYGVNSPLNLPGVAVGVNAGSALQALQARLMEMIIMKIITKGVRIIPIIHVKDPHS
jgi:hypothetical protein